MVAKVADLGMCTNNPSSTDAVGTPQVVPPATLRTTLIRPERRIRVGTPQLAPALVAPGPPLARVPAWQGSGVPACSSDLSESLTRPARLTLV